MPQWRRFERYAPNDLWQIDGTQVLLADESLAWIVDILDAHARFAIGATATNRCTSSSGSPPWKSGSSARPAHPQTCGKLERYHRTFKDFYADHGPAGSIEELQALCDQFRWHYNHQRPHQSLGQQLPGQVYQALPKVGPGDPRPSRRRTGPRVLVVSPTGSVHYRKRTIGIGMHWKGRRVTAVEATPDQVVVLDRATGADLRELTLAPIGTYHRSGCAAIRGCFRG